MENDNVKKLINAVQNIEKAVGSLANSVQSNSNSIKFLSEASRTHTLQLLALQISVQALLHEAATDPSRAANLRTTLGSLSENIGSQLLFTKISDQTLEQLPGALEKLLPAQLQLPKQADK